MDMADRFFIVLMATLFFAVIIVEKTRGRRDKATPRIIPSGNVNAQALAWEKIGPANLPLYRSRTTYVTEAAYVSDTESAEQNG